VDLIEHQEIGIIQALKPLTPSSFQRGLAILVARDPDLAGVVDRYGPPPMWRRKPCFATLVHIILEQQVSLASALAVHNRLAAIVAPFSATRFRQIDRARIKDAGLTRQKLAYCYHLADAIAEKQLSLNRLPHLSNADARAALVKVKGIGPWTADIYLLMALRRPDIWPRGDLALKAALRTVKQLPAVPSAETFDAIGDAWRPWRAVAARILWHFYLSSRNPRVPNAF
jgi:DNA-3-methyladenine glycosylase II